MSTQLVIPVTFVSVCVSISNHREELTKWQSYWCDQDKSLGERAPYPPPWLAAPPEFDLLDLVFSLTPLTSQPSPATGLNTTDPDKLDEPASRIGPRFHYGQI